MSEIDTIEAADYAALVTSKKRKYRNEPTEVDGIRFDSRAEARRYGELQLLQDAGEITNLEVQPRFSLYAPNDQQVGTYRGDFAYQRDGAWVVEDVKSSATKTALYRLKKKLVKACYGIEIVEVEA